MARRPRFLINDKAAWYHVHCRTSGGANDFPLNEERDKQELINMIKSYAQVYNCQIAAFCVMGNHYHLVIHFDPYKTIAQKELSKRAQFLYPKSQYVLGYWSEDKWKKFNERLFNISEFMRNLQSTYSTRYNRTYNRRGRIWAERYKSLYLEGLREVLDCMLYAELNPVRAGLVKRPEDYKASSANLRTTNKDNWLMPLNLIIKNPVNDPFTDYLDRLYYRGNIAVKNDQKAISKEVIEDEIARGFDKSGIYRQRLRYFVDGIALGSEKFIRQQIDRMRESGKFLRRKNPIKQAGGIHLTIREQRRHGG